MSPFSQKILQTLQQVLNTIQNQVIPLHEPFFFKNEWEYIKECLDTGWVSSAGKFVEIFELRLAEYTGTKYAVATVNGTAALHVCLKLVDVQPNDEVLIPALTFVATANAVTYCNAIPHFVDSNEATLGLCPEKLKSYLKDIADLQGKQCVNRFTQRRVKAVVPMHTFGHPVDLDPLLEVCNQYHLELVEDAAESLGSFYKGKHTGNWGAASALSFNGNKILTTGGGGAIITNDEEIAKLAKHLTTTAKIPHRWEYVHDQIGYNYRLPNINAALGCAQLEQLPWFLAQKRTLAEKYQEAFEHVEGIRFFTEPGFATSNYWLNVLILDKYYMSERNNLLQLTNDQGIMTRPAWNLLHHLPMFADCPRMELEVAESLQQSLINLPSSVNLIDK